MFAKLLEFEHPELAWLIMAQKQDVAANDMWKPGQHCKVYDHSRKRWVDGKVIEIFEDNGEEYVNVKYGKRTRDIPPNHPELRLVEANEKRNDITRENAMVSREAKLAVTVDSIINKFKPLLKDIIVHSDIMAETHDSEKEEMRDDLTWYNVMHCVRHELYPAMAVSMSKAVDELIFSSEFDIYDLSQKAVDRVVGVLKTKKELFNNEIEYIQGIVERARAFQWDENESMFCSDIDHIECIHFSLCNVA